MDLSSISGGFNAFSGFVDDILGFASSMSASSYRKNQIKLQQQQLGLDMEAAYRSSLDTLMQLGDAYNDIGLQLKQAQSNLNSADEWLLRYSDYYDYQMAQTQLAVDQQRLDISNLFTSNISGFNQLQEGLAQQQMALAERGQTGSTAKLLNAIQKQSLINFAGTDMTLDAEGGTYGDLYNAQQSALDIALMGQEQTALDFEADRQSVENSVGIIKESMSVLNTARNSYYNSFRDTLASTIDQGHAIGETYSDLSKRIDEYRDYLGGTDEDFARIKNELLDKWKPVDFEIRTLEHTWETGSDESEHGKTEHSSSYYQIYDKATGKLASQEQVENLLRTYAGNLKEEDWYGGRKGIYRNNVSNSYGLSDKAILTIMKNSNYNKRKDYK